MRRGFSIFLILFFGFGPLSAFVDGSEDASLPPCCRRHGAHHCAMYAQIMAMRAHLALDPRPAVSAPSTCPLYHGPAFSMLAPAHAMTAAAASLHITWMRTVAPVPGKAVARSIPSDAHSGRGPPASTLS
ncbi:MAG: hypothetical protein WBC92_03815 [Terracidiphilus sp.]